MSFLIYLIGVVLVIIGFYLMNKYVSFAKNEPMPLFGAAVVSISSWFAVFGIFIMMLCWGLYLMFEKLAKNITWKKLSDMYEGKE